MAKRAAMLIVVGALFCRPAGAIPPPWSIEEWKGQADLILIAKATRIEPAANVPGANSRIGLVPVEALKGTVPKAERKPPGESAKKASAAAVYLLFLRVAPQPPGPIRVEVMGGTGHPKPREGELALVFLKKDRTREGHFRAACGAWGYIGLSTDADAKAAVKKRIEMYRKWGQRVKDETVRKAMDGYYRKALGLLEGLCTLRGKVIRKPWSKSYESWNAGGGEYYVLAVDDAAVPAPKRSATEGVILRPSGPVPLDAFGAHKGRAVIAVGRFVEGKPYKPPAGSTEQRPSGPALRGSGFQVFDLRPQTQK